MDPTAPVPQEPAPEPMVRPFDSHHSIPPRLFVVLFIVIILISTAAFLIAMYVGKEKGTAVSTETPAHTVAPTPVISQATDSNDASVPKRLFTADDTVIGDKKLPQELLDLKDSDLTGINCTPYFVGDTTNGFKAYSAKSGEQPVSLTDSNLLNFLTNKNKELQSKNRMVSAISQCVTGRGKRIVMYEVDAGGGGGGNVAYFESTDASGVINSEIAVPNDGAAYFACTKPYALTNNNIFYYGCGGGDGGAGQASVYSLDLNTSKARQLLVCTSVSNSSADNPVGTSTVECK